MKRMKQFALSLLMGAALFSCGDDYDDTALKNEIDDLKTRVEKLEDWCDTANGQISALQGLVSAMEQNDYITGVTPVVEGTKETGYIITFAKSDPITILHGKNGTDGTDGNDGITPVIGAKQDTDGNYYWTIKTGDEDPVWMTDAEGNKIRTTGDDAVAVKPVISVDTDTDGKLYWKIDGEWLLDEANKKVPATGEKGDKGDKGDTGATGGSGSSGSQGPQGPQGPKGDAVFADSGVNVEDPNNVTFTLADRTTTFTVPRSVAISIGTDGIFYYTIATNIVPINLPANFTKDDYASIMAEVKSSYGTSIDIKTRDASSDPAWKVEVTAPTFDGNGKYTENSAKVTLRATNVDTDATAWLEVTILDTKGKKSTAACVIKVTDGVPVTTPDNLNTALTAGGGTSDAPAKIKLEGDITANSSTTTITGFNELDGNNKKLTNGAFTISSADDNSLSSLFMSNTTLENPKVSVSNNGELTLGEGVSVTSASTASNPFSVTGSGIMTVDGATFTQNTQTDGFSWINTASNAEVRSVIRSRSTSASATLVLQNFTFTNSNDYISISGATTIQMFPGSDKSLNLYLNLIKTEDLTITAMSGSFTQSDVERLSIRTGSIINGEDGDGYEFHLSEGAIKLKAKGSTVSGDIDMTGMTAAEAQAAIKAALDAGITELKLTGPFTNSGIGGMDGIFMMNTTITKIDLTEVTDWQAVDYGGDAVIGLPAYAFWSCTSLTEIKLPAAVKAIGARACDGCAVLTAINLGEITHVGLGAFYNCGKLASVDLAKATTLYTGAFGESGLIAVNLLAATAINVEGAETVNGSFYSCTQLASIKAPNLKNTGDGTFIDCQALKTVEMPALEDIGEQAFKGCTLLSTSTETFDGVKTVGEEAFSGCTSLTEMNLPAATTVGGYVFENCTALKTLNLPVATVFDDYIVSGCSSLKEIKVTAAGNLKSLEGGIIGSSLFGNWTETSLFVPGSCALTLNNDKQQNGSGSPTVNGNSWAKVTWQSISYTE